MASSDNEKEPQEKVQGTSDHTDDAEIHVKDEEAYSGPFKLGDGSRKKVSVVEFMGRVSSTMHNVGVVVQHV